LKKNIVEGREAEKIIKKKKKSLDQLVVNKEN
jgi:hypothetical protein